MGKVYLIGLNNSFILDLALASKNKGYEVFGSDDEISEGNKQKLDAAQIIYYTSYDPEHLNEKMDYIVTAPDVQADNPEVLHARKLNLKIMSASEFLYDRTKGKTRLVVAGSKGKKSLLSIIISVLRHQQVIFDYVLNSPISGIERMVDLSYDARIAVIEAEEPVSSPAIKNNKTSGFYNPHIALVPNIIPEQFDVSSKEDYIKVFENFVQTIERDGKFIYNEQDELLKEITSLLREDITAISYEKHQVSKENNVTCLETRFGKFPVKEINAYFLENLNAARYACRQLGVSDKDFYTAISNISMQS